MILSNLRVERREGKSFLTVDIDSPSAKIKTLWFSVEEKEEYRLTADVYDAFLVAMIYPAMYFNEPIVIKGKVNEKLYRNVVYYAESVVKQFMPSFNYVDVKVDGFANAKKNDKLNVGTGFSGGIDSFTTIYDRFVNEKGKEWKIDTLYFFFLGQYGRENDELSRKRVGSWYDLNKRFSAEVGLGSLMLDSNLFSYYLPHWELDAGVLCRVTAVLVLQRSLRRFYISSGYAYKEMVSFAKWNHSLAGFSDPYIVQMLSPDGLDIIVDGAQYTRAEKTEHIVDYPPLKKYLSVCVNYEKNHVDSKNCSHCSKCMRTMVALEAMGKLEEFSDVFDLKQYKENAYRYKCQQVMLYDKNAFAHDNVDFAASKGKPFPSYKEAYLYFHPGIKGKIKYFVKAILKKRGFAKQ